MNVYLMYGGAMLVLAGLIYAIIWAARKYWFKAGQQLGEAKEQAESSAEASKVQQDMADAMAQHRTADELADKWRKGGAI
jgi:uncharacterized protein YpmB